MLLTNTTLMGPWAEHSILLGLSFLTGAVGTHCAPLDLRMTFSSLTVSLSILKLPHCPCHSAFSSGLRVMHLMKTQSFTLKVLLQLLKGMCKILIQKFRVTVNLFIKKKLKKLRCDYMNK